MKRLERSDLIPAAILFAKACKASRLHGTMAKRALANYGDHGSLISGCVRDHFPNRVKDALRTLASSVTRFSDTAYGARPKGVRFRTMLLLSRDIATRDGGGFYGPRPH
jgi:hypothetical protein